MKRKKVSRVQGEKWMSGLIATTDYNQLKKADIIIEAVFEDLALKHKVIKEVSRGHIHKQTITIDYIFKCAK